MGTTQYVQTIPVVGEVYTVVDATARTVAAGAAAAIDQTEAAERYIKSASQTFVNYSEKNAIAANINVLLNKIQGNDAPVDELLKKQGEAWTEIGETTPVIGHVVGTVRYAMGDTEGGNRAIIGATRTALVVGSTALTGGGPLIVGSVATGCGYF